MNRRRTILIASLVTAAAVLGWVLFVALPRWTAPQPAAPPPATVATAQPESTPKIRARLYHIAPDGLRLQAVDAEVPVGQGTVEQARRLVEALLQPPQLPLLRAIPAGTTLRDVYLTTGGIAFVDLSREVQTGHSGGAVDELLTVYGLVNTLTDNLPAITGVQILVDGHEVETLAGHVDLRRPLAKNLAWTAEPGAAPATAQAADGR
jgi:spore germination protein GerM